MTASTAAAFAPERKGDRAAVEAAGAEAVSWLGAATKQLNLPPLSPEIRSAIVQALPWPCGDPRYDGNTLVAEGPPLEASFDESDPGALRFDFAAAGAGLSPAERRAWSAGTILRWVSGRFDRRDARRIEASLEAVCGAPPDPRARFGAFVGVAWDDSGLAAAKIYTEWCGRMPTSAPPDLDAVARAAMDIGLTPLFASTAYCRGCVVPRLYFLCDEEMPATDLHAPLAAAQMAHRLPELVAIASRLTGHGFMLPARGSVFSIRGLPVGVDCKLEFLSSAVRAPAETISGGVDCLLRERPESLAAFRRWTRALAGTIALPRVHVAGARVSSRLGARLSLYVAPPAWSRADR